MIKTHYNTIVSLVNSVKPMAHSQQLKPMFKTSHMKHKYALFPLALTKLLFFYHHVIGQDKPSYIHHFVCRFQIAEN